MEYHDNLSRLCESLNEAYKRVLDIGYVNDNDNAVRHALQSMIDACRKTVDALASVNQREIRLELREEKTAGALADGKSVEWISVREKTPKESGRYLVCNAYGEVSIADYFWDYDFPDLYWFVDGWMESEDRFEPIAWAQLPKPYEEES